MPEFSYRYREFVTRTLRFLLQGYASLTGRRFGCKTLSGEALLGCYVNSDMTLSCNCQDVDGAGRLGSLRQNTFEELFAGPRATHFRRELARGRLPLGRCAVCFSLEMKKGSGVLSGEASAGTGMGLAGKDSRPLFRLPKGFCVENTVLCGLHCLSCCREEVMATRGRRHSLSLEDVDVVSRTLRRLGAVFCGFYNLGEPFFSPAIARELEVLRRHNPDMEIFIATNGQMVDSDQKREAALLADHVLFSIDGVTTEVVDRYQRGGSFDRAYDNLKAVIALRDASGRTRPLVGWKYVVFRWNDKPEQIRTLLRLAEAAGVDYLQLCFARTPWHGMSWRFFLSPVHRSLAKREGRFRHIWFRKPAADHPKSAPPSS